MSIRFATSADTEAVKSIWNKCFGDGDPFLSWNFSRNYNPNDTLVWEDGGEVVATLQMQSKAISLYGEIVPGNYIFGIATLPEYRCKGIARELLESAIEVAIERGHVLSMLIPFNYRFYEKFGYKMSYKLVKASIKAEYSSPDDMHGHIIKSDYIISDLQNVYKKFCENLNGWINRSDDEFQLILEDVLQNGNGRCIVSYDCESEECTGYAIGRVEKEKFAAYEMAYIDTASEYPIIAGIFEQLGCKEIEVTSPISKCDGLISLGGYLDCSKIYPFAMTKVLNESKFYEICGKNDFFSENKNFSNMLFS